MFSWWTLRRWWRCRGDGSLCRPSSRARWSVPTTTKSSRPWATSPSSWMSSRALVWGSWSTSSVPSTWLPAGRGETWGSTSSRPAAPEPPSYTTDLRTSRDQVGPRRSQYIHQVLYRVYKLAVHERPLLGRVSYWEVAPGDLWVLSGQLWKVSK